MRLLSLEVDSWWVGWSWVRLVSETGSSSAATWVSWSRLWWAGEVEIGKDRGDGVGRDKEIDGGKEDIEISLGIKTWGMSKVGNKEGREVECWKWNIFSLNITSLLINNSLVWMLYIPYLFLSHRVTKKNYRWGSR